jgi:hypothetical protein
MRKILLFALLLCVPFTQMASVIISKAHPAYKPVAAQLKPAPELPLHVLNYFIQ